MSAIAKFNDYCMELGLAVDRLFRHEVEFVSSPQLTDVQRRVA